jgi:hypothetical protein
VNSGTAAAMILNFTIPRGDAGATGASGSSLVTSVAGKTGAVVLIKADINGLDQVDNTSDANKPVSNAPAAALNNKQNLSSKDAPNGYSGLDGTGKLPIANFPAASLHPSFITLTDGATITWNVQSDRSSQNAVIVLGGNRTLTIAGAVNGMSGVIIVKQDSTGGRGLTLSGTHKVINSGLGSIFLTSGPNSIDILCWIYDGGSFYWTAGKNYN